MFQWRGVQLELTVDPSSLFTFSWVSRPTTLLGARVAATAIPQIQLKNQNYWQLIT